MPTWRNKNTARLIDVLMACDSKKDMENLLRDLFTAEEIVEFGKRFQVAEMLYQGVSYSKIESKTKISSATIARISKWLNKGMGGYQAILSQLHHPNSHKAAHRSH